MTRKISSWTGKRIAVAVGAAVVVAGLILPQAFAQSAPPPPEQSSYKAGVMGFQPGMIISDDVFYNPRTMDAAAIQTFLAQQGGLCSSGTDTDASGNPVSVPCLKNYIQDTPTIAPDAMCPGGYQGAAGESAALIIAKVGLACNINPQVLLVTLQKEQGLITASGKGLTLSRYQKAMGYACPDTAACDEKYFGFFNQVYSAASRFQYYKANPTKFRHQAGRINPLLYHPKKNDDGTYKCGASDVFIENQATAGLYNYTPYTPNVAALAAGGNLGDECSSYGNRNFYRFFTSWFGSAGNSASVIASGRIEGADRIATAVGISVRAFPSGSNTAYIARSDVLVDALVGGTLVDGPVLLVPTTGGIPQSVRDELNRLKATKVVALGGPAVVPDAVVADVAQGRAQGRLFGDDRVGTAISVARAVFTEGTRPNTVYVADANGSNGQGSPDAVAAGMLTDGPVLLTNQKDAGVLQRVTQEIQRFNPGRVVFLGGPSVISEQAATQMAAGYTQGRFYGQDRYETAVEIALNAFPANPGTDPVTGAPRAGADAIYIARGDVFADAVAAGTLKDGPVLLLPPGTRDNLPPKVVQYLAALRPKGVMGLGGFNAVHQDAIEASVKAVKSGMR
ncbi:MAG: cell wall-binding repeat-containing protein [Actinomycetaceae bacterium]|nr:cell wall-binding repeat-containing protein [Actinomycetaceae bacterium]